MINLLTCLLVLFLNKTPGVTKPSMTTFEEEMCSQYNIDQYELRHSILTSYGLREHLSEDDIELMKRVVMSEAGSESVECQEMVATVILNRWQNPDDFPETIYEVIYEPGQFSTKDNGEPTLSVEIAVYNAIVYYNTEMMCCPTQVLYFRNNHYHNFGFPYCSIDNTYFSTNINVLI